MGSLQRAHLTMPVSTHGLSRARCCRCCGESYWARRPARRLLYPWRVMGIRKAAWLGGLWRHFGLGVQGRQAPFPLGRRECSARLLRVILHA
jgi:hypothetical protein